jgi:hypothetical protein
MEDMMMMMIMMIMMTDDTEMMMSGTCGGHGGLPAAVRGVHHHVADGATEEV